MSPTFLVAGAAVALVAAIRSTWSPCALSMLSAMTPLAERTRGVRFGATVAWFLTGAAVGGLTFGLGMALLAAAVSALDLPETTRLGLLGVAALVTASSDARLGGWSLPRHMRQVDEGWFTAYRRWVYASGFGWQIGAGLATFITSTAVYLLVAAAALSGEPALALALGAGFGLLRGGAILLGRNLDSFDRVQALHRRLDRWSDPSRRITVASQAALAVVVAAAAGGVWAAGVAGLAVAARGAQVIRMPARASLTRGTTAARAACDPNTT